MIARSCRSGHGKSRRRESGRLLERSRQRGEQEWPDNSHVFGKEAKEDNVVSSVRRRGASFLVPRLPPITYHRPIGGDPMGTMVLL